ncbi:helix-turn-helix domain-containing protein [Chitinophaga defluvii]|uniref:Helix-turn-helix transcriptional regulator n=1 Tax=Chitinophaga defluvii TaxID=3163343 RepID=A0ABV2TEJ8_9BACT
MARRILKKKAERKKPYPVTEEKLNLALGLLAERLKSVRDAQGFTSYEHFANDLEISRSQYGKYEAGDTDIRFLSLVKIILGMGLPLSDFFKKGFEALTVDESNAQKGN